MNIFTLFCLESRAQGETAGASALARVYSQLFYDSVTLGCSRVFGVLFSWQWSLELMDSRHGLYRAQWETAGASALARVYSQLFYDSGHDSGLWYWCVCVCDWGVHECLGCYSHDMITRTDGINWQKLLSSPSIWHISLVLGMQSLLTFQSPPPKKKNGARGSADPYIRPRCTHMA